MYVFSQEELEHLNEASAEINRLELQLDVCKPAFLFILFYFLLVS